MLLNFITHKDDPTRGPNIRSEQPSQWLRQLIFAVYLSYPWLVKYLELNSSLDGYQLNTIRVIFLLKKVRSLF